MLNTEWTQVEVLELFDQDGAASSAACFGFSILGGKSTGVVVKSITPGSISDLDGRLHCGDHILYVGTICVRGLSAEQVAAVLRQQTRGYLQLIVARQVVNPQTPPEEASVAAEAAFVERRSNQRVASAGADELNHAQFRSGPGGYCSAKAPIILTHQLDDYLRVLLKRLSEGEREAEGEAAAVPTGVPHDDDDPAASGATIQRVPSIVTPDDAGFQQVLIVNERRDRTPSLASVQRCAILPLAATIDGQGSLAMDTSESVVPADGNSSRRSAVLDGVSIAAACDPDNAKRRSLREHDEALSVNGNGNGNGSAVYNQDGFIELFDVDLRLVAGDAGFGIRVAGYLGHVGGVDLCGIFVKSLIRNSPAARDGRIHVNDQLIGVNGTMLTDVPNHVALQLLRSSGDTVCLRLARHKRGPIFEQLSKLVDNTPPMFVPASGVNNSAVDGSATMIVNGSAPDADRKFHNNIEPILQSPAPKKTKHDAVLDTSASLEFCSFDNSLQSSIVYWRSLVGSDIDIIVAELSLSRQNADRQSSVNVLGCSIQTATMRDDVANRNGRACRPLPLRSKRHFITELTPTGAIARDGRLRIGDEILEINGKVACGRNSDYVLSILNEVHSEVRLLCGRRRRGPTVAACFDEDLSSTAENDEWAAHRESSIISVSPSGESDSTDTERFGESTTDERSSSVAARRRRPIAAVTPRSCASASSRLRGAVNGAADRRNVSYSQLASDDYADYDEDSDDDSITPTATDTETDATDRQRYNCASRGGSMAVRVDQARGRVQPTSAGSRSRLFGSVKSKSDTNLVATAVATVTLTPADSSAVSSLLPPQSASAPKTQQYPAFAGNAELRRSQKLAATGSRYAQYAAIRVRKEANARKSRARSGSDRQRSAPLTAFGSGCSFSPLSLPKTPAPAAASTVQQSYFNLIPLDLLAAPAYRSHSLQPLMGMALWNREPTVIDLQRPAGTGVGLGFSVAEHRDPFNPLKPVIVVRSLVPGGVADLDGRLTPGDRLLFINQVRVDELVSYDAVLHALRSIPPGPVRIGFSKVLPLAGSAASACNYNCAPAAQPISIGSPLRTNGAAAAAAAVNGNAAVHDDTVTVRASTPVQAQAAAQQKVLSFASQTQTQGEQFGLPEPPVELLKSSSSSDDSSVPSSMTVSTISEHRAPAPGLINCDDGAVANSQTTATATTSLTSCVSSRPSSSSVSTCTTNHSTSQSQSQSQSHSKASSGKRQRGSRLAEPPPLELTESDVECLERLKRATCQQQQQQQQQQPQLPPVLTSGAASQIRVCLSCRSTEPHAVGSCTPSRRCSQIDTPICMPVQQTDCGKATFSASFVATIGDESVPIQVFLCDRCVHVQAVKPAAPQAFYSFLQGANETTAAAGANGNGRGASSSDPSTTGMLATDFASVAGNKQAVSSGASSTQNLTTASTVSTAIGESDNDLRVFQV